MVAHLRKQMQEEGLELKKHNHDVYLARFSRGAKRDPEKAFETLKKCIEWRLEEKVDTIDEWWGSSDTHKRFHEYYPTRAVGRKRKSDSAKMTCR